MAYGRLKGTRAGAHEAGNAVVEELALRGLEARRMGRGCALSLMETPRLNALAPSADLRDMRQRIIHRQDRLEELPVMRRPA